MVQGLPGGFKARGSVDYFSDVTVQQQYQMDLYNATLRTRNYQGNVSGSLGRGNSISGTYGINEIFYGDVDSQTIGGRPRIQYNRALTKLGPLPLYFTADGEYASIVRYDSSGDVKINDQSLTRYDISPSLQFPLTKWPFLSVRSSITWQNTYWTESLGTSQRQVDEPLFRQYFDMRASVTGPILTKVWNTPDNGYAERFKHVVEPEFVVQRTTQFDDYDRIVKIDGGDYTYRRHDAGDLRRDEPLPGAPAGRRGRGAGAARPRVPQRRGCSSRTTRTRAPAPSTAPTPAASTASRRAISRRSRCRCGPTPTNAVGASLRLEYNAGGRRVRDHPGQRHRQRSATGCRRPAAGASASTCRSSTRCSGRRTTSSARAPT